MHEEWGYLSICCGCMFSGKTSWLMQQHKKYEFINKNVVVVNYDQDKRYHNSLLSTHDKQMIPCIQAKTLKKIIPQLMESDVILINEGQFFEDLYEVCINMVEKWDKRVHIAALDGDFKQQVFGDVLKLIPKCDDYVKLHAIKTRRVAEHVYVNIHLQFSEQRTIAQVNQTRKLLVDAIPRKIGSCQVQLILS